MSDHDKHDKHKHEEHHHHDHSGEAHPNQLEPPHEVFHDANAGEVLRAWISNGHLSLSLHGMAFGKADVWGHLLAGIAEQVSISCSEMGEGTPASNLEAIRKNLDADLGKVAANLSPLANQSKS